MSLIGASQVAKVVLRVLARWLIYRGRFSCEECNQQVCDSYEVVFIRLVDQSGSPVKDKKTSRDGQVVNNAKQGY